MDDGHRPCAPVSQQAGADAFGVRVVAFTAPISGVLEALLDVNEEQDGTGFVKGHGVSFGWEGECDQ